MPHLAGSEGWSNIKRYRDAKDYPVAFKAFVANGELVQIYTAEAQVYKEIVHFENSLCRKTKTFVKLAI